MSDINEPRTPEEIDAYLRSEGIDPNEAANRALNRLVNEFASLEAELAEERARGARLRTYIRDRDSLVIEFLLYAKAHVSMQRWCGVMARIDVLKQRLFDGDLEPREENEA